MNKKNNRKGFTIVELVIVIAVIAILATVLVPTFGDVIAKANKTSLLQEVKNEYTNYTVKYAASESFTDNLLIKIGDTYYVIENGAVKVDAENNVITDAPAADDVIFDTATDTAFTAHAYEADADPNTDGNQPCCGQDEGHFSHVG